MVNLVINEDFIISNSVQFTNDNNNSSEYGIAYLKSKGFVIIEDQVGNTYQFKQDDVKNMEPYSFYQYRTVGRARSGNSGNYHQAKIFYAGVKCYVDGGSLFFYNESKQNLSFEFVDSWMNFNKRNVLNKYSQPPHTLSWYYFGILLSAGVLFILTWLLKVYWLGAIDFIFMVIWIIIGFASVSNIFGELIVDSMNDLFIKNKQQSWLQKSFTKLQQSI